jgi:hypothetical protein
MNASIDPIIPIERLLLVAAALLGVWIFVAWRTTARCRPAVRALLTGARLLGVGFLVLIALNPGRWEQNRLERDTEWAVLVDRSFSMSTADAHGKTRWSEAVRLAQKAAALAKTPVTIHPFAADLEPPQRPGALAALKPDGATTDISRAGTTLLGRAGKRALCGVLLISDGGQNAPARAGDFAVRALASNAPVFALPLGGKVERKDLSIAATRSHHVAFAGQKLKLSAVVRNSGLGSISPAVTLLDASGKKIDERKIDLTNNASATVTFDVTPETRGWFDYLIKTPPWPGENVEANNEAAVSVTVLGGKVRIFMAEGVPYWDSKFLVQLLRNQPNLDVTSVYRLASDRFFKLEADVSKASQAEGATFPDDAAALNAYDVIVFGKGVEYFLTPERIERLRAFVRDQGGAVLFARGKPYSGAFPELEPLEPVSWGEPVGGEFHFQPAQAGEDAGLFGDLLPRGDDPVWKKMPPLQNAHRVAALKSFAQVLAEGALESAGERRAFPAVVSRRFGKGLVAVINADGLWEWDFFPVVSEAGGVYKELWPQLVQWAATYSDFLPGQDLALRLSESQALPDAPVRARIKRRSASDAAPFVRVLRAGRLVQETNAVPAPGEPENWDAILRLGEPGAYRVEVGDRKNPALAGPGARLVVNAPPSDKDDPSADRDFLAKLTEASGGKIIGENELAQTLQARAPQIEDTSRAEWAPVWDKWWLLCLSLGCFCVEWFVRRRNGLS